jgi:hypothetical protein
VSVPVALDALAEQVAAYGEIAFLVTVGPEGTAHVVSVRGRLDAGELIVGAGRTTSANVGTQAAVTLLWPGAPDATHSLIVDGTAKVDGDTLRIVPTAAVLHRRPDADASLPSCIRV